MPNELESQFYFDQDEKSNLGQSQGDEKTEVMTGSTEYIDTVFKEFQDLVDRHSELIDEQKVVEYSNLVLEFQDFKDMFDQYKEKKQEPDEKLCMTAKVLAEKIQPVLGQINLLVADIGQTTQKLYSIDYIKTKIINSAENNRNDIEVNVGRDVVDRFNNGRQEILTCLEKLVDAVNVLESIGKFQEQFVSFSKKFNDPNPSASWRREEYGDIGNCFWNGFNMVQSRKSILDGSDIVGSIFNSMEFVNQLEETVENKKIILENNGNIAYGRDSYRNSLYKFKIDNAGTILKYTGLYLENKNSEVPNTKNKELVGEALKNKYLVDIDKIDYMRNQVNLEESSKEEVYKKIFIGDLDNSKNHWQHELLDKIQARGLMPVKFNTR